VNKRFIYVIAPATDVTVRHKADAISILDRAVVTRE